MTPRDLGLAAIDEQLDARDIARVVRREKGHRLGGLVARTGAAPRRDTGSVCFERIDFLVVHAELGLVARSYDRFLLCACVYEFTTRITLSRPPGYEPAGREIDKIHSVILGYCPRSGPLWSRPS